MGERLDQKPTRTSIADTDFIMVTDSVGKQYKKPVPGVIKNKSLALVDGATITWDYTNGNIGSVTLGGNRTINVTNVPDNSYGLLLVKQDATGSRTLTLPGLTETDKEISSGANEETLLGFFYNGTDFYWSISNFGASTPIGPTYITWFSIESAIEQYNSNQGLRKKSGEGASWTNSQAWSNQTISVGESVSFKFDVIGYTTMGLNSTRTANNNNTPDWAYVLQLTSTIAYGAGAPGTDSGVGVASGNIIRLSYIGSNIVIEKSVDNGLNWTSVGTIGGASGPYYVASKIYANNDQTGYSEIYKQ